MEDGRPFRVIDPSGRNLHWVLINDQRANTVREFYESDACRIVVCPRRNGEFGTQDLVSRPCFSEGRDGFFRLKDEVHEWLVNAGLERAYQFEFRYANGSMEPGWHVGFLDKNSAMLFKLAWGL
jgi:hypothetical protein